MIQGHRTRDELYTAAAIATLFLTSLLNAFVGAALAALLLVVGIFVFPEMRRVAVVAAIVAIAVAAGIVVLSRPPSAPEPTPAAPAGMTPDQAAQLVRTTVTGARPLLIPNVVPPGWLAEAEANASSFTVTYRDPTRTKEITLAIAAANPPLPTAVTTQAWPGFHGDASSLYQVADGGDATSPRWLLWSEQGTWSEAPIGRVPYLLSGTGVTHGEFWSFATGLHPNQL